MIAQIYMRPAHLIRINTIRDDQMVELSEHFGINYRKGFLNCTKEWKEIYQHQYCWWRVSGYISQ